MKDWRDDDYEGFGSLRSSDEGYSYVGHFSAGKKHGKGQEQKYGIIYEGYFSGDHWHGSGQLTLRGGHTIKARFKKSKPLLPRAEELVPPKSHFSPDTAIWIDLEETRLWIGNFLDGKPHGKGSMHYFSDATDASPFRCANGIFDHGILVEKLPL